MLSAALLAGGCSNFPPVVDIDTIVADRMIREYHEKAGRVHLGDEKVNVLALLPGQAGLGGYGKRSVSYTDPAGKRIDIFFYRSARIQDGVTTDDEFVPYIFVDNTLTWIGWSALDGPRSLAWRHPPTDEDAIQWFIDRRRHNLDAQPDNVSARMRGG